MDTGFAMACPRKVLLGLEYVRTGRMMEWLVLGTDQLCPEYYNVKPTTTTSILNYIAVEFDE